MEFYEIREKDRCDQSQLNKEQMFKLEVILPIDKKAAHEVLQWCGFFYNVEDLGVVHKVTAYFMTAEALQIQKSRIENILTNRYGK